MKINKFLRYIGFAAITMAAAVNVSCSDDDDLIDADRLFRPVNIAVVASENTITATWAGMDGAVGYYVELYEESGSFDFEDESYKNKILVASEDNLQATTWTVSDLKYEKTYYFRVRTNAPDPAMNSRFSSLADVKTPVEFQVLVVDVLDDDTGEVRFEWLPGYDIERIVVSGANFEETIDTSEAEVDEEGKRSLGYSGLAPGAYTAIAYDRNRGYNTYTFEIRIIRLVAEADITVEGVTLRWGNAAGLSSIVVTPLNGSAPALTIDISSVAGNVYTIPMSSLLSNTEYAATIYQGEVEGNTVYFTTMQAAPAGMIVLSDTDDFKKVIEEAADGAVIALKPGTYRFVNASGEFASISLTKAITVMAYSAEMPRIFAKSISITAAAEIDLIRFENVYYNAENETTGYVFDVQNTTNNVNRIELEGCTIEDVMSSLMRDRGTASKGLMNLYVNDCQMYNMNGNQSFIAWNNGGMVPAQSVTLTNSTITNIGHTTTGTRFMQLVGSNNFVVNISNNTILTSSTTNQWIHYRVTVTGSSNNGRLDINNNILMNMNYSASAYSRTPEVGTLGGWDLSNNDIFFAFSGGWDTANEMMKEDTFFTQGDNLAINPQFPGVTVGQNTITINSNDFTVVNNEIKNKGWGDPRWLK